MLNIVLDNDTILGLLSRTANDLQHRYTRLQKSSIRFWIPCCSLSLLETQIVPAHHHPLSTLLDNNVQLLSSLAAHWREIPANHRNKSQALMSLDAAVLPGTTIIWTNNPKFASAHPDIESGDHEAIYALLAQSEEESPLVDLTTQQLNLRPILEKQWWNVLKHGQYILGPEVPLLEQQLAAYVGAKHCIAVANGTEALLIALMAIGIKAGDEVITSPFNFIAAAEMIALLGAKPVFVDIEPNTYLLNPALLPAAITTKTKAIIPVSLYGQCADFDTINNIATAHKLPVIEDAGQSFGATYKDRHSCTLSTIGCTSFFPTKPLGAYGDAGACFTEDDQLAAVMRRLRVHGQEKHYQHRLIGLNSRLDTLQASILLAKLSIFDKELENRAKISATYTRLLSNHPQIKTPVIASHNSSVYAQYTVAVEKRDQVQQQLKERGIPTAVHYPVPIHLQPAFSYLGQGQGSFPVAETAAQRVLSLPMHPYLIEEGINETVGVIKKVTG
jgi:UDP-2-acetamido-2-deoxy-ribo-hexuluronate aminotransferase